LLIDMMRGTFKP